jgi:hypothetical protein
MDLRGRLLDLDLRRRVTCDSRRGMLFLDLRHLHVRRPEAIASIRDAVEKGCREIGQRVATVVNDDGFQATTTWPSLMRG